MEGQSVLVVEGAEFGASALDSVFADSDVSIVGLADHTQLFDRLTRNVFHCLVLPGVVDDQRGVDIALGVTELFPELPVIVAGTDPDDVPADLDVVGIAADRLSTETVADAVRGALTGSAPSVAGREPSPMETMLLSMLEGFPVHLYAKDAEARHVVLSRNELEPTDLLGKTDLDFTELPEAHRRAAYRDERRIMEQDDPRLEIEEYTDYIDSHSLTSKVPWYDQDGEVDGIVGFTQDISEYKAREHASRRQHERLAKVALVAAHEFRNELQVAHGRLELLDGNDDRAEIVMDSLSRMSAIVDTVIELAAEERDARDPRPLWLSTLSREIWDTIASDRATLRIEEDQRIVADPESASLFLQILFKNALEHVGPEVTVTVGTTDAGFYVADDGFGFVTEPIERVLDAGFTTVEGNTGFGLYVARSIAKDHDWTLSLSESVDGGARFDLENVELTD